MLRLLPTIALALVAGCATPDGPPTGGETEAATSERHIDLRLTPAPRGGAMAAGTRTFSAPAIRGWVTASGDWSVRAEVSHSRLRCATYEVGIRIGRGDAACSQVEWLTEPAYGTRLTQCNAATRIHSGGGVIALPRPTLAAANCVRVLTRCNGAC